MNKRPNIRRRVLDFSAYTASIYVLITSEDETVPPVIERWARDYPQPKQECSDGEDEDRDPWATPGW